MRSFSLGRTGWTWWHVIGAIVLGALAIIATRDPWIDIFEIAAKDEESSHILLVPIVAAWMIWSRRIRFRLCSPGGHWIGPLVVAVGWLVMWTGFDRAIQAFWHAGAVIILTGAVLTAMGKNVFFRFLPAFLVLAFMVPVHGRLRQQIAEPLQSATAATTQAILETFGLDVVRSANHLTLNGVDMPVDEAFNGLRMVFALVLVSYAFAFSMPLRNSVRLIVLLCSPLAAILCNVARLAPTMWMYAYAPRWAETFHNVSGWLMLPVAFLLLLGVIRLLRWALIPVTKFNLAYQ